MDRRAKLYKKGSRDFASWKEHIREKCFTRIKSSREALMELKRSPGGDSLADKIINQEWSDYMENRNSRLQPKTLFSKQIDENNILDVERIMKEIKQELKDEESRLLKEIEEELLMEEHNLNHLLSNEVVCPVCQIHTLSISINLVMCHCGVNISLQNPTTCELLQASIDSAVARHAAFCNENLEFIYMKTDNSSEVYAVCRICDAMEILLSNVL